LTALFLAGVGWLGMHDLRGTRRSLGRHAERLRMLHEIDRSVLAEQTPEEIAAAVVQPLRELLGVPRAIVNRFDLAAGEVEWVAAAGRHRTHVGPGVRYSIRLMGDLDALRRGELQHIDVAALPAGPETAALLASDVRYYTVVPMIAGGELLGALSFGGPDPAAQKEHVAIVREVSAQLAIALAQARLLARVRGHAAELESRVQARTAELEATNRELESFSYSVSHDLRAPLRAVDGYARMLEEDYSARLDEEGRRLLGVVRGASTRMGQLIDDLLAFSQLGRQTPVRRTFDMTALAREVVGELNSERAARVELAALPAASADPALLKQVWSNLVGNALKYSSKSKDPRVEIGARTEAAENVYWVRDNGVGFDPRYAAKLFGVFQRLHRAEEFPGTGVGLAIVQRVVTRHGGRVWAESALGEGACFYFSLPRGGA
jgi:signal transduction histidine kinase